MNYDNLSNEQLLEELTKEKQRNAILDTVRFYDGKDRVREFAEIKKIVDSLPINASIKSKLPFLDKLTGGFEGGELVVVSGSTGSGKTTFAQSLAWDFSDNKNTSLFFTYEVGVRDFIKRFGDGVLDMCLPMELKPYDLKWLEQRIWEGIAKFNIKAVFIDHLHYLVSMDDLSKSKSTSLAIGYILRELKMIAIKTRITIFLITHTTKLKSEDEPSVNDIRDSSFVGQESDIVLMIWRDRVNKIMSYLKVDKNRRKGNLDTLSMNFVNGRFRQSDMR